MRRHLNILISVIAFLAMTGMCWGLDCSHKPPCPPGTTAQESITCDACCVEGLALTAATDQWCCPIGQKPTADQYRCIPNNAILKSDGTCYVMAETDPCCKEGWHSVNKYECCPNGYTLATDNESCCTSRADGKCCPDKYIFNDASGSCRPPKPVGVVIR